MKQVKQIFSHYLLGMTFGFALGIFPGVHAATPISSEPQAISSEAVKAASTDETAVKAVAEQLYKDVFKDEKLSPNLEAIKPLIKEPLFVRIKEEYGQPMEKREDGYDYQFVPGNGGAEKYAIQTPEMKGDLATVTVIFDGRDGTDGTDPAKMLLQLERQPDGLWKISEVSDFYEGKTYAWTAKVAADESPSTSEQTQRQGKIIAPKDQTNAVPLPDKAQCIGKNPEAVCQRTGLDIRESRTIDPENKYALEFYGTREKITTVFFGKVVEKKSNGTEVISILDVLVLPPLAENQFFSHCADVKEKRDDELLGIAFNDKQETSFKPSVKTWRANVKTGKFEEVSSQDVQLAMPTEEDGRID